MLLPSGGTGGGDRLRQLGGSEKKTQCVSV